MGRLPLAGLAMLMLLAGPQLAGMGMGNARPVVTALTASASPVPAGTGVVLRATATDDGAVVRFVFSATGGVFANGALSIQVPLATPGSPASVSTEWTADTPGTYTLTCNAWDNGGLFGAPAAESLPATVTVTVTVPSGPPPVVVGLAAVPSRLLVGTVARLDVDAQDPGGGALSYVWRASAGTVTGTGAATPQTVLWTAPALPGLCEVAVTVTNPAGRQATASASMEVVWAAVSAPLCGGLGLTPARLAAGPDGDLFVADPATRSVRVFTPLGGPLREIALAAAPSAVAIDPTGVLYVADTERGRVDAMAIPDEFLPLGTGDHEFLAPCDLAVTGDRVYVADSEAGEVRVFDRATRQPLFALPGGVPVGIAVEPVAGRLYVLDAQASQVRVHDLDGRSASPGAIGGFGTGPGGLTRAGGLALGRDGCLYVVDTFQASVSVFAAAGPFITRLGRYGTGPGELRLPLGIAADGFGRILVASADNGRIEVYRTAESTLPARPGDADMDGIPDAWEAAHGLNPRDPADAFQDADQDGLCNLEEYVFGTDPRNADTDGDGVADIDEILAGTDPRDPADVLPVAVVGPAVETDPTVVALDGSGSRDRWDRPLAYEWTQLAGPETAEMAGADTASPTMVLRAAGAYSFRLRVHNGRAWSAPATAPVLVRNVAPTADAGPGTGGTPGQRIVLDGRFSSDANRELLGFAWEQVSGPPVALEGAATPTASFVPAETGVYGFALGVRDAVQESSPSLVYAVVDSVDDHVPVAAVRDRVFGTTGTPIGLDGSSSLDADGTRLVYAWRQRGGEPVVLDAAQSAVATFTPTVPGAYVFELTVSDGHHQSLPALATALVAAAGGTAPLAEAGYDRRVRVYDEVTISGAWSAGPGAALADCSFAQVEGVHVPLEVEGAQARFVPIEPGTYGFEVTCAGDTDRVTVVVDDPPRCVVPVALAAVTWESLPPASPRLTRGGLQDLVTLRGGAAPAAAAASGFAWTQDAGPRAILDDPHAPTAALQAPLWLRYAFSLRVDNGVARSPPCRVEFGPDSWPLAEAGADRLAVPGAALAIDATGRRASAYRWEQVGGPRDSLVSGLTSSRLTVVPARSGTTLRFRLVVMMGRRESPADDVEVSVADAPLALGLLGPAGGTLAPSLPGDPLDGLALELPESALAAPQTLALGVVTSGPAAPEPGALGGALLVGPLGLQLLAPATLAVPLDAAMLATAGLDPAELSARRYDHDAEAWVPAEAAPEPGGDRIVITIRQPGVYEVLALATTGDWRTP